MLSFIALLLSLLSYAEDQSSITATTTNRKHNISFPVSHFQILFFHSVKLFMALTDPLADFRTEFPSVQFNVLSFFPFNFGICFSIGFQLLPLSAKLFVSWRVFFFLVLFPEFKAINWIYVVNWEEKCPFENFSIRIIAVIIFWAGIFHHLTL